MPTALPNKILAMTVQEADRLLEAGDGDCMMLYVALLRNDDVAKAQSTLHWSGERVRVAYLRLVELGLASEENVPAPTRKKTAAEELPRYSRDDVSNALRNEPEYRDLVLEVERLLGKELGDAGLQSLYTIYDGLALPAEVVLMLVGYMIRTVRRQKQSEGAVPRMPEILNKARYWKELGLQSAEAAEEYLRQQERVDQREWAILSAVGVTQFRPAVEKEREFISNWVEMKYSDALISMAYEDTVYRKGRMNWPYMNKILLNWHQQGWTTPEQVKAGRKAARRPAAAEGKKKEDYQPTSDRIQKNSDWLDEFLRTQEKER